MGGEARQGNLIRFGPYELDLKNADLRRKGTRIPIEPQALKLLSFLVVHPRKLLSRDEVCQELWPGEKDSNKESLDLRLNFEISAIRKALNDNHINPRYVQTVRKHGYRFIAPVQIASERKQQVSEEGNGAISKPGSESKVDSGRRKWTFTLSKRLVAEMAIVILGFSILGLRSRDTDRPVITFVSPLLARSNQPIVIRGNGLGSYTNFTAIDSPFLAIRDQTAHWAAGRIMGRNWDKITLTVTRWLNSEIDVTSFDGPYGQNGWKLNPGDEIEVAVWNPQTGAGPALYHLKVAPETSPRPRVSGQADADLLLKSPQ